MDPGIDIGHILKDILPNAGVAGALALMMFHFYRKDAQENRERWEGQSEMLIQVVKENTAAVQRLTDRLDR